MRHKIKYFSHDGRELSEAEALDANGVMRSGVIARVPMTARDAASRLPYQPSRFTDARSYWDANRDSLLVVDPLRPGSELARARPGYRTLNADLGLTDKAEALRDYETFIRDAYKGAGEIDDGCRGRKVKRCDPQENWRNAGRRSRTAKRPTPPATGVSVAVANLMSTRRMTARNRRGTALATII